MTARNTPSTDTTDISETSTTSGKSGRRQTGSRGLAVFATVFTAFVIWLIASPMFGVDLGATMGSDTVQTIGLATVVGASLVSSLAAWGLRPARTAHLGRQKDLDHLRTGRPGGLAGATPVRGHQHRREGLARADASLCRLHAHRHLEADHSRQLTRRRRGYPLNSSAFSVTQTA